MAPPIRIEMALSVMSDRGKVPRVSPPAFSRGSRSDAELLAQPPEIDALPPGEPPSSRSSGSESSTSGWRSGFLVEPHVRHRVEWTDPAQTTIWLTVHYPMRSPAAG